MVLKNAETLKRVTVYEELVELCEALKCKSDKAPLVLSQLNYWTEITNEMDQTILEKIESFKKIGDHETAQKTKEKLRNGWFFKSAQQLSEEIMLRTSRQTVDRCLREFEDFGLVFIRSSELCPYNNVNDLKLNIPFLRYLLNKFGYTLMNYPVWEGEIQLTENMKKAEELVDAYLKEKKKQRLEEEKKELERKQKKTAKKQKKTEQKNQKQPLAHDEQPNKPHAHDEQPEQPLAHGEQPMGGYDVHGGQPNTEITITDTTLLYTENTLEEEKEFLENKFQINEVAFREFENEIKTNYPHLLDDVMLRRIKTEMVMQELDMFTVQEGLDQLHRMSVKLKKRKKDGSKEVIFDFAKYFVGGILLNRQSVKRALTIRKQELQKQKAAVKKKLTPKKEGIVFYNWLEE